VWASFQLALASLDRISEVLALKNDMKILKESEIIKTDSILEFN
jgi:ATP-binding cassette, subfamily B, bacterial